MTKYYAIFKKYNLLYNIITYYKILKHLKSLGLEAKEIRSISPSEKKHIFNP